MNARKKLFLMSFGIVALSAVIFYSQSNAFAGTPGVPRMPDVMVSNNPLCGVVENKFRAGEDISITASHLVPSTLANLVTVDVYVFPDRIWSLGEVLADFTPVALVPGVPTTDHGRIDCTQIWTAPLVAVEQNYDVVIDADKDGFISVGDYYDGGRNDNNLGSDFKVAPPRP